MNLTKKKCIPCERKGIKAFTPAQARPYHHLLSDWDMGRMAKKISKTFLFGDFVQAMSFIKKVATLAEREGHHPDIFISYNRVVIDIWTHSVKGLTENDFILGAKINTLLK
jgi:4a-hydroxytetrahydrobiopterin dehydratase